MESARIIFRWIVLLFDGLSFSIFGIAAFIAIFISPFMASEDVGFRIFSKDGLMTLLVIVAMWAVVCVWFDYSRKVRHEQVRGYWLPIFWLPMWTAIFWFV